MRRIVVAADSFKGSLSSLEVGEAVAAGVSEVMPDVECVIVPVADGGEGTVEALVAALGGEFVMSRVTGPLGDVVEAKYGICGDTAVIEMAAASGLPLINKEKRNPWLATSFGTGELIRDALQRGCRKFLIGLGGSATNDAGVGMLQALGFNFLDKDGNEVGRGGGELDRIVKIDSTHALPELQESEFIVACDVNNPLTGPNGASRVFGPQKGADSTMVEKLDDALKSFARVVKEERGEDVSTFPGAGAAGGMGFAFLVFLNSHLQRGVEMVLEAVNFDTLLQDADLVITGEGRLDAQTVMGKTPYGVLKHAKELDVPVIAIGGSVVPEAVPTLIEAGFYAIFPIVPGPMYLQEALRPNIAKANITRTVNQILRLFQGSWI